MRFLQNAKFKFDNYNKKWYNLIMTDYYEEILKALGLRLRFDVKGELEEKLLELLDCTVNDILDRVDAQ